MAVSRDEVRELLQAGNLVAGQLYVLAEKLEQEGQRKAARQCLTLVDTWEKRADAMGRKLRALGQLANTTPYGGDRHA